MKRSIAYCRQSFKRTNKESSIKWQQSVIASHAEKMDYYIDTYYTDIKSAKNTDRTGFQDLVAQVKSEAVDTLFVYRIDRLSRDNQDLLKFLQLCSDHSVNIYSVTEGSFNYANPGDRVKLQILAIVGELQRTISRDNREISNIKKFNAGKPVNYAAPFGYRYDNGNFEINAPEAKTVKFVFKHYLAGNGYKKIAQMTQNNPSVINRNPAQVRSILLNEKHTGVFKSKYGTLTGVIPYIISKDTFKAAKDERIARAEATLPKDTVDARLRTKIICPYCSSRLTTYHYRKQTNSQPFYVCQKKMSGQYDDCAMKAIPLKYLENIVLQQLHQFLLSKEQLQQLHREAINRIKQKTSRQQISAEKYSANKNQLIEQLAAGDITLENFKLHIATLDETLSRANTVDTSSITPEQVAKLIKRDVSLRHELWSLIKDIRIDKNQQLTEVILIDSDINIVEYNRRFAKKHG